MGIALPRHHCGCTACPPHPYCTAVPQLDEFSLNLGSQTLGEVKKLDIGFATQQGAGGKLGGLFGKNWHLMSAEVVHLNTGLEGGGWRRSGQQEGNARLV